MKYILIYLFSILIVTFLVGVISHYLNSTGILAFWLVGITFYSFLILGTLLILMFFFHLISESILSGLIVSIKNIYPTFLRIVLLALLTISLAKIYKYISNVVVINIENKSNSVVEDIVFDGKNVKYSVEKLDIGKQKQISFRGKGVDYKLAEIDSINSITINYMIDGNRHKQSITDSFVFIPDTLIVRLYSNDSLSVHKP